MEGANANDQGVGVRKRQSQQNLFETVSPELSKEPISKSNAYAEPKVKFPSWKIKHSYIAISITIFLGLTAVFKVLLDGRLGVFSVNSSIPPHPEIHHGSETIDSPTSRVPLDISLHPNEHNERPPTTLYYSWRITSDFRRPDGVLKRVYLVNDVFPGPLIEARSGDILVIEVENAVDDEDVAIHWHGLHMRGANRMDGAVGFTQSGIRPGTNFTYEFNVGNQHGSFWYHAHSQVERADGLYGGLIVHKPLSRTESAMTGTTITEKLLLIGDWYHRPSDEVLEWYMRAGSFGNEPVPDSLVVNGQGSYQCSDAVPARPVDCEEKSLRKTPSLVVEANKEYRLRIMNTGTLAGITIHFQDANATVIEVDGGNEVAPKCGTSVGILHPGERVDLLVHWQDIDIQESQLCFELDEENFRYPNPALSTMQCFPVQINAAKLPSRHPSQASNDSKGVALDELKAADHLTSAIPSHADIVHVLYTTTLKLSRLSNIPHGFINQTTWMVQEPPLIGMDRLNWNEHQLVPEVNLSKSNDPLWVDVIVNNLDDGSHPFHLHGYDFWVLQVHGNQMDRNYWGSYNPFEDRPPGGPYELTAPIKKDTVVIPRRGYAVIRFLADNPGIWMFQ